MEKESMKKVRRRSKKDDNKRRIAGLILAILNWVLACAVIMLVLRANVLPTKYLVALICVILLISGGTMALLLAAKKKSIWWIAVVLTLILSMVYGLAVFYLGSALGTLKKIINTETTVSQVAVYVRSDSSYEYIEQLTGQSIGVLGTLDRENTEKTLEILQEELGEEILTEPYLSLTEMVDALLNSDKEAVLLNTAYIETLKDVEGYENIENEIRELKQIQVEIKRTVDKDVQKPKEDHNLVIYVSGIDTRSGKLVNSNSDVNIIVVANMDTHEMLLVSTPRDFYVPLSISDGVPDKLTHAGIYGVDVSRETLEMLYDLEIDYYVKVNFSGFEKIVDSLGGITVHSDYAFSSHVSASERGVTYSYREGENDLNGAQALYFARERYAFSAGDRQRGKNQMEVIKGIVAKVTSVEILKNYTDFLDAIEGCMETDIPMDVISELVKDQLDGNESWHITSCSVDGTGDSRVPYSLSVAAYVMIPDETTVENAKNEISRVLEGN